MSNNKAYNDDEVLPKGSCGEECSVWSRVTGYFRPVSNWNHGKKEEFKERKTFNVKQAVCSCHYTQSK